MSENKPVFILQFVSHSSNVAFFYHSCIQRKDYVGWQIQPNGESVQEVVQNALSIILRGEIVLVGAGRTDAGVHARK